MERAVLEEGMVIDIYWDDPGEWYRARVVGSRRVQGEIHHKVAYDTDKGKWRQRDCVPSWMQFGRPECTLTAQPNRCSFVLT